MMTAVIVLTFAFVVLGIVGLVCLLRTKIEVNPKWAETDANHLPENWKQIVEAQIRAEKEQAG